MPRNLNIVFIGPRYYYINQVNNGETMKVTAFGFSLLLVGSEAIKLNNMAQLSTDANAEGIFDMFDAGDLLGGVAQGLGVDPNLVNQATSAVQNVAAGDYTQIGDLAAAGAGIAGN